jgi:hypothetical protein
LEAEQQRKQKEAVLYKKRAELLAYQHQLVLLNERKAQLVSRVTRLGYI